jgi:hypothetical protein
MSGVRSPQPSTSNPLTRKVLARRIITCADFGEEDPEKWVEYALGGFGERPQSQSKENCLLGRGQEVNLDRELRGTIHDDDALVACGT